MHGAQEEAPAEPAAHEVRHADAPGLLLVPVEQGEHDAEPGALLYELAAHGVHTPLAHEPNVPAGQTPSHESAPGAEHEPLLHETHALLAAL